MGQALYRKYRSKSLDEIVGQSHITDMLARAIKADKVAHGYLLTGPRGVGKTSIARILAHEINQLPYTDESVHLDIIEIDAASNNSVEDIRDLRDKVQIAPTSAKRKVYIIDEVHMLSKPAFNALLKTLEEPPEHVVFILATTDVDKLPATIISRVQRFNFRLIHPKDATKHMRMIADREKISIDDEALMLIAEHGRGSFRDSISLLDQLQNLTDGTITRQLIEQVLGLPDATTITTLIDAYQAGDISRVVTQLDESERRGTPMTTLAEQLIYTIRQSILTEPDLLPLLDRLLDVTKSNWPHIKLLTALTTDMPHKKNSAASITHPHTIDVDPPQTTKPMDRSASKKAKHIIPSDELDWQKFIDTIKSISPGTATLLNSSSYRLKDSRLTIYTGNKFTKSRLDKSLPMLAKALSELARDIEINITDESVPPSNSQTAAVLDIMGGGEEVKL